MTRQDVVSKVLIKKADYALHLMFCAWGVRKGKPSTVQMKCRERITKDQEQPLYQIQRMSLLLFSPSSFLLRMSAYGHSPTWSIVHKSSRLSLKQRLQKIEHQTNIPKAQHFMCWWSISPYFMTLLCQCLLLKVWTGHDKCAFNKNLFAIVYVLKYVTGTDPSQEQLRNNHIEKHEVEIVNIG